MGLFGKKKNPITVSPGNGCIMKLEGIIASQKGLPSVIPEFSEFSFELFQDRISIKQKNYEFILKKEQVIKFDFKREQIYSGERSLIKGVIGEAAFGTTGAIIGSAPKESGTPSKIAYDFCITYINQSGNEAEMIFRYIVVTIKNLEGKGMVQFADKVNQTFFNVLPVREGINYL